MSRVIKSWLLNWEYSHNATGNMIVRWKSD